MLMFTGTIAGKALLGGAAATVIVSTVHGEWALPANTLLLILLTLVTRRNGQKVDENTKHVVEAKDNITNAASAAASAAAAAAVAAQTAAQMHDTVVDAVSGALADRRKDDPA